MSPKSNVIYQIKVTLNGSRPPIWRRIQVRSDTRLDQMHEILQVVMGWENYHLHQFILAGEYFGEPHDDYVGFVEMKDHRRYKIGDLLSAEGDKFIYEYDFGDSWEHILLLEKILDAEKGTHYPTCTKGKQACPPEDIGGIWGYVDFLEAISDPEHEMHEDYLDWVGDEFDPDAFDLEDTNRELKRLIL